jgi:Family of unknown function (DUF6157)
MTTNYINTFIAVSPDTNASSGVHPKPGTAADEHLQLLQSKPYGYTSDELLFAVHADRADRAELPADHRADAWAEFVAKPRACLRASALVKQYGWGLHHDEQGHVAAFGTETDDYQRLKADARLKQTQGMRSKRA